MSRRRNLEHHRRSLAEIRDIMNSMKTLAYMETRKLARFLDAQHAVVQSLEAVAADLLSAYPDTLPEPIESTPLFLIMGTERGFCGDFNHALLTHLESALQTYPSGTPALIPIGRKLHTLLEGNAGVVAWVDGASVGEEITSVLNHLVDEIISLQSERGALEVFCLYQGGENGLLMQRLLPPFQGLVAMPPRYSHPPALNLTPSAFLIELTDQYLFAALHAILYASLMEENHHRVTHLEGAVSHLDDQEEDLTRQANALRQEEIIEEIEVILLSATSLGDKANTRG